MVLCPRLLAPTSVTVFPCFSDCLRDSSALTRYVSGREHARKLSKRNLSRVPSNSRHLSFGSPLQVTGRELVEQKVTALSSVLVTNEDGRATLYESMTSKMAVPVEHSSIAATIASQTS